MSENLQPDLETTAANGSLTSGPLTPNLGVDSIVSKNSSAKPQTSGSAMRVFGKSIRGKSLKLRRRRASDFDRRCMPGDQGCLGVRRGSCLGQSINNLLFTRGSRVGDRVTMSSWFGGRSQASCHEMSLDVRQIERLAACSAPPAGGAQSGGCATVVCNSSHTRSAGRNVPR